MLLLIVGAMMLLPPATTATYAPTWPSLNSRATPDWWRDAGFGISLHWGVYSVPAFNTPGGQEFAAEWYWNYLGQVPPTSPSNPVQKYHLDAFGSSFHYQEFAPEFKATLYDPDQWASIFARSGAKWAILTSKHHDGFCLWPSERAFNWNSVDVGPHRDLVGDFVSALRKQDMHVGLYHSLFEWFNPVYRGPNPSLYVNETLIPDMKELVTKYEIDSLLVDGEWEQDSDFWQTKPFLAWLFNESPVKDKIAVDDRWGKECRGKNGGFYVCENGGFSDFCSGSGARDNATHPWAYWATMGYSWGYSQVEQADDYKKGDFFIPLLVRSRSNGGNLILNLGPTSNGLIPPIQQMVLEEMGDWLSVNGEAIYNCTFRASGARHESFVFGHDFPTVVANENNVYGVEPAANSSDIVYLGKFTTLSSCQTACGQQAWCLSYTYHDNTTGAYVGMCYGRSGPEWSLVAEAGHFSGRKNMATVYYTVSRYVSDTLFAMIEPYPATKSNITLTLAAPVVAAQPTAKLLGYGSIDIEHSSEGLTLHLPVLTENERSKYVSVIKIEGAK
eukprot:m.65807 g.65807  ORF g.65807 m.65807 type:complete len:558 (-) comp19667_c0_seq1:1070-2743(-)